MSGNWLRLAFLVFTWFELWPGVHYLSLGESYREIPDFLPISMFQDLDRNRVNSFSGTELTLSPQLRSRGEKQLNGGERARCCC